MSKEIEVAEELEELVKDDVVKKEKVRGHKINGIVKWFDFKKGYGYIIVEDIGDVFVHFSNINGEGFRTLYKDQVVELVIEETEKGKYATDVYALKIDKEVDEISETKAGA